MIEEPAGNGSALSLQERQQAIAEHHGAAAERYMQDRRLLLHALRTLPIEDRRLMLAQAVATETDGFSPALGKADDPTAG